MWVYSIRYISYGYIALEYYSNKNHKQEPKTILKGIVDSQKYKCVTQWVTHLYFMMAGVSAHHAR